MDPSSQASGSQPQSQHKHSSHKKRKHAEQSNGAAPAGAAERGPNAVKVTVLEGSSSAGPAWVNFPAVRPSRATPFKLYRRDRASDATTDFSQQQTMIAGETGDVEFYSLNRDAGGQDEQATCQYLPALYDPSTKSLVIHPSTPTYIMAQRVKRLKALPAFTGGAINSYEDALAKRTDLGIAFGTKKAQSRIKAVERNRVDAGAQEKSRGHLMASIGEVNEKMPMMTAAGAPVISRLIPTPNTDTTDPAEVYPLTSLIPPEEYAAIDTKPLAAKGLADRDRAKLLPYPGSIWLESKLRLAVALPSDQRKRAIKIIYYIAAMRQLVRLKGKLDKQHDLPGKMNGCPRIIIDGLIQRFTETAKGAGKPTITLGMENKIMAHDFALRLHLENYACDYQAIATDLEKPATKIREVFKSLGCTCEAMSAEDRKRMGMSVEDAKSAKRAILQAPPVFPLAKRGPPQR